MPVAENIRHYLKTNGIMQNVVAERTGMRADAFSNALNGKRKISIEEYIKICAVLGKPIETFIQQDEQ